MTNLSRSLFARREGVISIGTEATLGHLRLAFVDLAPPPAYDTAKR